MRRTRTSLLLSCLLAAGCSCGERPVGDGDAGPDAATPDGGADEDGGADSGPLPPVTVSIFEIQDPGEPGHVGAGTNVRVEGAIVAAIDAFEERAGVGFVSDVWVADPAGGEYSGVHVYMPAHVACAGSSMLGLGDTVTVEGTIQEFAVPTDTSGETVTQLIGGRVECTSAGDGVGPSAQTIADPTTLLAAATAEPWEGVLVEIGGVEAQTDPDAFGVFMLRNAPAVDDDLYRHPGTLRDTFTQLRGIFHYMYGRWAFYPRASSDIVLGTPRPLEWDGGQWKCADGVDSDGDTAIDCSDDDCSTTLFCRGPRLGVQDVQDATSVMHPAADTRVSLVGPLVVTAVDTFEEMAGIGYVGNVVVQDPAASDPRFSGIHVFLPEIEGCGGGALAVGDRVYVAGRYREYAEVGDTGGTLSEIANGIVSCSASGAPLAPTLIASAADLTASSTAEPWEGVLVEVQDVTVTSAAGMYGRFTVTGGAFIDDDLYRTTVVLDDRILRIAGIATYQFEYQLEPRSASDVEIAPPERDDAACGNGLDDDMDGVADCLDMQCCATAPCAGAVSSRRLILSEVVYDSSAADDGREWVELRNAGASPVPLSCYAIGNGGVSYRYSLSQLPAITVPPGGCLVVGGPTDCGGATCDAPINFEPDYLNGATTASEAAGVALLYGPVANITSTTVPVDAVLYGGANTGGLLDASGTAPANAHIADVSSGHSIERDMTGVWVDRTAPTAGTCTMFTPP